MKIAWLAPYPVSQLGNSVNWAIRRTSTHPCSWITNLSRALATQDCVELHLLTICPWVARSQVIEKDGLVVHLIKCGVPFLHRGWPAWIPVDAVGGFWHEISSLRAELAGIHPDIVHGHGTEKGYALAAMASGYPYIISIQGVLAEIYRTDPSLYIRVMIPRERRVVQRSRYFSCRTHFDIGFVRGLNPLAKIFDIPEAMNPVFWGHQWKQPRSNRVLFIGGGVPLKGLHRVIEAASIAAKVVPNLVIEAVGSCSPTRQVELKTMAENSGVTVRFRGQLTACEIAHLHRECDVFVLASSSENSPNALAEAMVSGMPCVAFNVGGVSSMVDDCKTGLLVPPGDIEGLAAAIRMVLVDRDWAAELGAAAARIASIRYKPEHVAAMTLAAYREVLAIEG